MPKTFAHFSLDSGIDAVRQPGHRTVADIKKMNVHKFNEVAGNQKRAKTNKNEWKKVAKTTTNYQLRNIFFMCANQFVSE